MIKHQRDHDGTLYAIYLELAGRYHPDVVKEPRNIAEARFREIEKAYEVLRDALRHTPPNAATLKQRESGSLSQNRAVVKDRKGNVEQSVIIAFLVAVAFLFCYLVVDVWHRIAESSPRQGNLTEQSSPPPQTPVAHQGSALLPEASRLRPSASLSPAERSQPPEPSVGSLAQPPLRKEDLPDRPASVDQDNRNDLNSELWKFHQEVERWRDGRHSTAAPVLRIMSFVHVARPQNCYRWRSGLRAAI